MHRWSPHLLYRLWRACRHSPWPRQRNTYGLPPPLNLYLSRRDARAIRGGLAIGPSTARMERDRTPRGSRRGAPLVAGSIVESFEKQWSKWPLGSVGTIGRYGSGAWF